MKLLLVTGMSGSGKSKALNYLEDNGFYCLDNLPTRLLPAVLDMVLQLENFPNKLAVTADIRNNSTAGEIDDVLKKLRMKAEVRVLFLDCENSVLLKRYKESRRLHPLMMYDEALNLQQAISEERKQLEDIRKNADYVIDTSLLATSDLRGKILELLSEGEAGSMRINFVAFGYKYGIPTDTDLVFDVRCLPNPFYQEGLKAKTGNDAEVRDYVMSFPSSERLYKSIIDYLECAIPMYENEGKVQLVVGIGCTGGQHRSLTFAILLAEYFGARGLTVKAYSRDIPHDIRS